MWQDQEHEPFPACGLSFACSAFDGIGAGPDLCFLRRPLGLTTDEGREAIPADVEAVHELVPGSSERGPRLSSVASFKTNCPWLPPSELDQPPAIAPHGLGRASRVACSTRRTATIKDITKNAVADKHIRCGDVATSKLRRQHSTHAHDRPAK